jgi:zinc transport system substrate-binding protein
MHDAWYYFAKSFGLEVVGVYEPSGGEEPTPGHIADLGRKVHENNIKIFFSEPQLSEEGAKAFANDNRLDVRVLDPIGGVSSRNSYEEIIRYNVLEIVK